MEKQFGCPSRKMPKYYPLGTRSRFLESLEDELIRCEEILESHFDRVLVMMPSVRGKNVFYPGLLFKAHDSEIRGLKERIRAIGINCGMPGKVVLYKMREEDVYYYLEIRPFYVENLKDFVENSRQIANYLASFLKYFCRQRR